MAVLAPKKSVSTLPKWAKDDIYWHGALYILGSMADREPKFRPLLRQYVNLDESTIDFFAIKRAVSSWSHGEKIMVNLAAHLFNETHEFKLSDLDYLGGGNSKVALKAIEYRFMR
ncbi:hypothetical protein [Desulfosporosinus metallidurans]|uniref:Uncharacterized protein n=1 Tax=Desulfosporosinus metallidurans TaxID=1888891 RepID=A0A1Q8QRL3_9FIRM|nr:hypothetical protein [Desulfosporosinus metallidurans]OLN29942.1 hypothetical protein DSOL_3282 [Desulfosporosinus metallidurans]